MIVSVASGKGGTGKTFVSVNLALSIDNAQLLDCDVEEPNSHLFIKPKIVEKKPVHVLTPKINEKNCDFCKKCSEFCEYNAIVVVPRKIMVFYELCHNCGGCILICPKKAITEDKKQVGVVEKGYSKNLMFVSGRLSVGEPRPVPVINEVKKEAVKEKNVIVDSPPGTSCPVIASVEGSDFCILVTEPTPFGLYDLRLMVETVKKMGIKFGVVVNKAGIGNKDVYKYCEKEKIPILLEIPYSRKIAELYSQGKTLVEENPEWKEKFSGLFRAIRERMGK
ncbi:MAG: (4Fe-4S)-binding protein [Candidatus Hecatellales archaeon]|nr:MAG: (4Fe-4S)-binding protein [Candidatus Hecatellales archaeon]